MFYFFFFSSRRRHTRYWRDWSSDVCSSDLASRGHMTRPLVGVNVPASYAARRVALRWSTPQSGSVAPASTTRPPCSRNTVLSHARCGLTRWVRGEDRKSTRPELQSRQYIVCRLLLEKKE